MGGGGVCGGETFVVKLDSQRSQIPLGCRWQSKLRIGTYLIKNLLAEICRFIPNNTLEPV